MTVSVGDILPQVSLKYVPYDPQRNPMACPRPIDYNLAEELKDKKAVIFAIPGAFTPTCSEKHVPEFLKKYDELKKAGIDVIICTAANDGFVMDAFGQHLKVQDKIIMASDGESGFFQKLGLTMDSNVNGLVRSKRFALVVDNLKVTYVGVDEKGVDKSGPEAVLKVFMQRSMEKEMQEQIEKERKRVISEAEWVLDTKDTTIQKPKIRIQVEPSFLPFTQDTTAGRKSFKSFNKSIEASADQEEKSQRLAREEKAEESSNLNDEEFGWQLQSIRSVSKKSSKKRKADSDSAKTKKPKVAPNTFIKPE
ncbi:hypothetical protein [Parasitella parasitica]|uniref:Thioredoxin-dependent peroxiredoxin n=1 Tax=Parasitella parasitica TaxID=35722 RepID=A0A0B7N9A9_9FUNG|nr:hypothetical protein [Parasitella parasitica]